MKIWSQFIYIEIAYFDIAVTSGNKQLRRLFCSSDPVPFCQPLPLPWVCMHLMKQPQPSGAHALPLSKSVKQLLLSKLRLPRCSLHGRKAPASHRPSKVRHCLVYLSIQSWLSDCKPPCACWQQHRLPRGFCMGAACLRSCGKRAAFYVVLQSYSKMIRASLLEEILQYFKLEVW